MEYQEKKFAKQCKKSCKTKTLVDKKARVIVSKYELNLEVPKGV